MKYIRIIFYVSALLLTSILMVSCGEATGVVTGSLRGYLVLLDEEAVLVDHSAIKVEVYKKATLDSKIETINLAYPLIGVVISQETEFDHRLQNPVHTSLTNASGYFEIKEIPIGEYNIVLSKEGWGFSYKLNHIIYEGTNELSTASNPLALYPEILVSSNIIDDYTFETDRHYIITENTNFHTSSHITIKPGAFIRINPAVAVTVFGPLTVETDQGRYFRITSNDGFNPLSSNISNYSNFSIRPSATVTDQTISGGVFTFGNYSLNVQASNTKIVNSVFSGHNSGITYEQVSNVLISNSLFRNTTREGQAALYLGYVEGGLIEKSIFYNNNIGITLLSAFDVVMSNNFFSNNYFRGIMNWYDSNNIVTNCVFTDGEEGVANAARSYVFITYSVFHTNVGLNNFLDRYLWAWPTANYNNFYCSGYAVVTNAHFPANNVIRIFSAEFNYWGTTNAAQIEALIWDRYDISEDNIYYQNLLGVYDYQPYLNQPVAIAGIQVD